jgi:hypothetical protein
MPRRCRTSSRATLCTASGCTVPRRALIENGELADNEFNGAGLEPGWASGKSTLALQRHQIRISYIKAVENCRFNGTKLDRGRMNREHRQGLH